MFRLIGVPIDSAESAGGTELAPAAFRELGLGDAIDGRDGGDLYVRIRAEGRDPDTGVVGLDDVVRTTTEIRRAVRTTLESSEIPFLIGGCCTMVPGAVAGVADAKGGVGLANLDGHLDLYDEKSSPLGEAADMPVAVALGLGPASWVEAADTSLTPDATWIVGYRDRGRRPRLLPRRLLGPSRPRHRGPRPVLRQRRPGPRRDRLGRPDRPDVPPVAVSGSRRVSLVCYNPEKDRDGANGRRIVQVVADAFGSTR